MAAVAERAVKDPVGILVVDDRPSKLLAMEALLSDLGEQVVCVSSGPDALRQLLERDFAVVLLDVNMPDMDGFETAAFIRQRPRSRHVPIIFMTAGSDETNALHGYSLGAVDYILTPIVPEVLRTKVRVFVDMFRMTQQLKRQAEERIALAEARAARAAAEEAQRRTELLAEAGKTLGRSLDLEATMRAICGLFVPDVAESVRLCLLRADGIGFGVEASAGPVAKDLDGASAEAMDHAARSRTVQLVRDADGREILGVAYPLVARESAVGVLSLAAGARRGGFDLAALGLVEALGSRAASAVDNCLLFQEIQQRDVRKDQFVAMLAHELRNPLGAITSAVGVIEIAGEGTDAAGRALAVIRRQLKNLTELVDDLLDVSRVTSGKITLSRSTVNLADHVEHCLEIFRATGSLEGYAIAVEARPVCIDGDPTRLDQVISNLIGNAVKYTHRGGRIRIRVEPAGEDAVLEVADNGVGMSADVLARAFELFFQADTGPDRAQGGLGVGLTLVRQLVELHGGHVTAESAGAGQGSRFTVRLPRSAARPASAAPARAAAPAAGGGARILVIEDNADARQMLAMLLGLAGHEVHEAADGHDGLAVTESADPEIVLVDIGLPGLDGYEVARRLRGAPRGSARLMIALTGYGQPEDRQRALDAGFDAHIVKPVDPNHLSAVITSLQRARREERDRSRA